MQTRPGAEGESFAAAHTLITSRQNVSAKRLLEPGPSEAQCEALLQLAAAAPDHGQLTPWRFVTIPVTLRHLLGEVFALALLDRDPGATPVQMQAARDKALRAPRLILAVACLGPRDPDTPALERMVSLGAAIQNILLGAHAMGFGAGLTSGQAMASPRLQALLGLAAGEQPVCCINIGSVSRHRPSDRVRPAPAAFARTLAPDASIDGKNIINPPTGSG